MSKTPGGVGPTGQREDTTSVSEGQALEPGSTVPKNETGTGGA
jgi:hypothetical protein